MAEYADREHYIPLRLSDLVELLAQDKQLPPDQRDPFRRLCRLVSAVFHFEYHSQLEELKDAYAPFDPDRETRTLRKLFPDERQQLQDTAFDKFIALMERANFTRLHWKDVETAIRGGASDWGLDMDVDPRAFERLELFVRGDGISRRTRRVPWHLWRKETVNVPSYQRLAFMVKLRPHVRLGPDPNTEAIFLKVFKDIPKLDLEMLLPGARLHMPRFRKLQLGGSLLSGLGFLLYKVAFELWDLVMNVSRVGLSLLANFASGGLIWGPIAALLGFGYRQYYAYNTTRQAYTLQLSQSLYYQNLDNNAGVLTRLLDEAEEQECRETLLGYFCLWRFAPPEGWTAPQLDDYVEMYLEGAANLKVDFEIGDALAKLERLRLVTRTDDRYQVVPLEQALVNLDYTWDNYFPYNNEAEAAAAAAGPPPAPAGAAPRKRGDLWR
jgi:hypothetical protein